MLNNPIILSEQTKQRIEQAFRAYWLSPFCSGVVQIGETLISWALDAVLTNGKAYADAYNTKTKIAYQIKTGLHSSPVTFARLTTPSQFNLVNSSNQADANILGRELLDWVQHRINEPRTMLGASRVHIARVVYSNIGNFIYYERNVENDSLNYENFTWRWSNKGNALEGYYFERKWFSWYPQGREKTRNQNQVHFHGENALIPESGAPNRHDFYLGKHAQISFSKFMDTLQPLLDDLPKD